jgi:hypothetical protein
VRHQAIGDPRESRVAGLPGRFDPLSEAMSQGTEVLSDVAPVRETWSTPIQRPSARRRQCSKNRRVVWKPGMAKGDRSTRVPRSKSRVSREHRAIALGDAHQPSPSVDALRADMHSEIMTRFRVHSCGRPIVAAKEGTWMNQR